MVRGWRALFFVAVLAAGSPAVGQQVQRPARDTSAVSGDGVIRGRVTAAGTEAPLHRVRITLNGPGPNPLTVVTDVQGEFAIDGVPSGTYTLSASRNGYLPATYGARRPDEQGRPIDVRPGTAIEDVTLVMQKGGVLAGRVADEEGVAAPGARVEAIHLRYISGRRVPVAARIAQTNDLGEFRLSGLPPGAYQVRASTTEAWTSDDGKSTFVHAVTYYPGVTAADVPQTLAVAAGQELRDLDIRLIPGRAARITGLATDVHGNPLPRLVVNIDRIMRTVGGDLLGAGFAGSTRTDEQGRFELTDLAPGELNVYMRGPGGEAAVPVMLNDGDTRHLLLTPRRPTTLAGSVVVESGRPLPVAASRLSVLPVPVATENVLPSWNGPRGATLNNEGTFQMRNLRGAYLFRVAGLPGSWMIKSVTLGGRDLTDAPLDIPPGSPGVSGLSIVLTDDAPGVTGDVVSSRGEAAPQGTLVLFAENRALWGPGSRYVRTARPDRSAKFTIGGVPPGIYRLAAVEELVEGQAEDPEFLQGLMRTAQRLELSRTPIEGVTITMEAAR